MESKNMHLVKFNANWADEFDVQGFQLLTQEELNDYLEAIDEYEYFGPGENELFYFGANQSLGWASKEEFLKTLTITKISNEEFSAFKENLTGSHQPLTYGVFPDIEFFL